MKYGLSLPNGGVCGDARVLAELGCLAEEAGWDGVFVEDYIVHRLIAAGIGEVEAFNLDTYADSDRFFSFRRATHRGEADYGRQLSAIAIPG